MRKQRAIVWYVSAVVAVTMAAIVVCSVRFQTTFDVSTAGLAALSAFAILALLAGVIESATAVGIAGSVVFVAHLAAVVVVGPLGAAIVAAFPMLMAQVWLRREPIKVLFNMAQITLCTVLGGLLYLGAGGHLHPAALENQDLVAYSVLVVGYFAINSACVSGAVALSTERRFADVWRDQVSRAAGYDILASAIGLLVAVVFLRFGFLSIFALFVPILVFRKAYLENGELKRKNAELAERHIELLEFMVKTEEAQDPYTSGHSRRVSTYAQIIAREAGLSSVEIERITTAALLHDIGKIYPEFRAVLLKEGKLTQEERKLLQGHPTRSAELVSTSTSLRGDVEAAVRHHHENYNGTGYPEGLAGGAIPLGSRVIMIADTIDSMTTDRPYRRALSYESAIQELLKYSGQQFDPQFAHIAVNSSALERAVGGAPPVNLEMAAPNAKRSRSFARSEAAV